MLNRSKLAVIYITDRTFWVGIPTKKSIDLYEVSWNGEDLTTPFAKLKEQFSVANVRIVLGNSLAQVAVLKQAKERLDRESILASVKEFFAEDVQDLSFDWRALDEIGDATLIEITAAPNFLLQHIKDAAQAAKITIEAIKPVGVLLAEQTKDIGKPHLIIWRKQEALALIAFEGSVYQARDIETYAPQRIQALLNFNVEHAGLPIDQATISWSGATLDQTKPTPEMPPHITSTTQKDLDVMSFFAGQKISKGKDANVLDLLRQKEPGTAAPEPSKVVEEELPPIVLPQSKMPIRNFSLEGSDNQNPWRWVVVLILVLLTAGGTAFGGYYFLNKPNSQSESNEQVSPAPLVSPTTEPSPTPVDLATLKLKILNGSGAPGEAGRVESLLQTVGFGKAETGNADSYDYEQTQIEVNEHISEAITQTLIEALAAYELEPVKISSGAAEFDISIIVGSTKK